ncbi:carbohydrate esterase family 8 protein [Piloderma croceum F 1598]|uniref:Pectinesterase n=1 Tax=Piloderma croceum (strain F 1598) TaxID=765440 RepID=A0A0C3G2C6_PILCF|nr:carbohydrate esterase family 8 protein [Piloderma croceum F 1598]
MYSFYLLAIWAFDLVHYAFASASQRGTPPTGSLTVGTKLGTYTTISAAVAAASKGDSIFVYAGTYTEAVYITVDNLTIYGQTDDTSSYESNTVTLTFNGAKATKGTDDASGTLRVHANSFAMYNIKVVNTYGIGNGVGSQALALSAYGTEQGFYGCSFVGYQDTLYTYSGTQYFGHSYIEGAVDFIFGKTANTYIRASVIASVIAGSTITAPGPPSSGEGIYVIESCTVKAADDAKSNLTHQVYLGRPWTQYAQAVFKYCSLSDIINPAGWKQWSTSEPNTANVLFAEFGNTGDGSNTSQRNFSTTLTSASVAKYSISAILGSGYNAWVDPNYL